MSNENENRIKIRLEIDIPTCCGQPEIDVSQSAEKPLAPVKTIVTESKLHRSEIFTSGISVPSGSAWAQWDAGAGTGRVCSAGEAIDGEERADHVILKIEPGEPGAYPDRPAGPTFPVNQISGRWGEDDIVFVDGVTDHPNETPHTIYCWAKFDRGYVPWDTKSFTPIWTSYPYCDYPAVFTKASPTAESNNPSFDVLPKSWTLETMGFSGKTIAGFNGAWELTVRPNVADKVLYCNGGDGKTIPTIQLQCELPNPDTCQLSFTVDGNLVTYSIGINEFDPQSANVFKNATTSGIDEFSGIPAAIKITPK